MTFHLRNYNTNGSHQHNKSHREFSTCPCLLKSSCHKPCLNPGVWNIPFQTEYLWSDPDQTMLFASSCGHKSPVVDSFIKTINILNLDSGMSDDVSLPWDSYWQYIELLGLFYFQFFCLFHEQLCLLVRISNFWRPTAPFKMSLSPWCFA